MVHKKTKDKNYKKDFKEGYNYASKYRQLRLAGVAQFHPKILLSKGFREGFLTFWDKHPSGEM